MRGTTTSSKQRYARRVFGCLGAVLGTLAAFVVATVLAVLVHVDVPASRRLVASLGNGVLASTLAGDVRIERIGSIGLGGVDGVRVFARDPEGVQVLHVDGVRVRLRALGAARSALWGKGPIVIQIPAASIGHVDANLDVDAAGNLRIANAFSARHPSESKSHEPPGRGVRVEAPELRLGHAWIHGGPRGAVLVDADVSDLAARAFVDPNVVRADLDRVHVMTRAMPRHLDPTGSVSGHVELPAPNGQGMTIEALFDGDVGGMQTSADVRLIDRTIDARIDTKDGTGSSARRIVSEVAIHEPLTLHAEAHGDLSHVQGEMRLVYGNAQIVSEGVAEIGATTRVNAAMSVRHVDLSKLVERALDSDLGLDAQVDLELGHGGQMNGEASIDTLPGVLGTQSVPRVFVRGVFEGETAHVRAHIRDRAMPTEVAMDVSPRVDGVEGRVISAAARACIADLRAIPVIGAATGGSAEVDASARLTLPDKTFDANAEVRVRSIATPHVGVQAAMAKVHAGFRLDRPTIDAEVHAKNVLVGTESLATVDAHTRVELEGDAVNVRMPHVEAGRSGSGPISVDARLVKVEGSSFRVEHGEVLGLGAPIHADISKDTLRWTAEIDAPRIDLGLVARFAHHESDLKQGTLGLRGDVVARGGDLTANVHSEVTGLEIGRIKNARGTLDATVLGREIALEVNGNLDDAGHVAVRTEDLAMGGNVMDPASWRRARGYVRLDGEIDMEKVASLVPPSVLPFADLRGMITVQGRVGRDAASTPPEVEVHAHTNGLLVAGPRRERRSSVGVVVEQAPAWRSTDVELGADVRTDGKSGLTDIALRTTDRRGPIVTINAKAIIPYDRLMEDPSAARERVLSAPLSTTVVVAPRRLDQLPTVFGVKGVEGAVEAQMDAVGTLLDPHVHLVLRGRAVHGPAMPPGLNVDSDVVFDYDGEKADLVATVGAKDKELLRATSHVEARARDVIVGSERPLSWNAAGRVRLASFPLEALPALSDRRIKGEVSGELSLDGLHEDARVKGVIDVSHLTVGKADYEKAIITVSADSAGLEARARLDQKDGFFDARVETGLSWGNKIAPTLDANRPVSAKLEAKAFRAAALQPFVDTVVPVLDGRIDALASAKLVPGRPGATMDGSVTFRDGTVQIAALGEELRRVRADVKLAPDGTIRVENAFAKGVSGEVRLSANARLDGLRLASMDADVRIPDRKALDVAVSGQSLGQVSGTIKVHASQSLDERATSLVVDVPKMTVSLPQVMKSGVQQLEKKDNVVVGVRRDSQTFVELPLDKVNTSRKEDEPSRLEVDVRLGRVEVQRGNQARVTLSGNPKVVVEDETKIFGQINAVGGWVDVQGKKFVVERGTITFAGEVPPNPVVVLTAGWTAADSSRIFADFVGPVKTGKVVLRSEPPRPKNEILALVVFGTADGANPTPPPPGTQTDGTMKTAVGIGGGYAAQGLTEALDDLAGIQATARIDTTRSNNPRPEVEFQLDRKVTVGFAHVLGTPPITEPDKNFVTIDYRFHKNWSMETTVGDRGSAVVDGIWQKRY